MQMTSAALCSSLDLALERVHMYIESVAPYFTLSLEGKKADEVDSIAVVSHELLKAM